MSKAMNLFKLRQSALLFATALIWGCTFVAQSMGMDSVGPFTFTSARMALGVLVLLPFVALSRMRLAAADPEKAAQRRTKAYRRTLALGCLACGLCLFGGESLQQFGLAAGTSAGKSGFITSLYIVLVPLLSLALGRRPGPLVWGAVVFALAGLWLLCLPAGSGFSLEAGDLFTLGCAFVFSLHILVIAHFVGRVNPIELSCGQFFVGCILGTAAAFLFETPTAEGLRAALLPILWAGIMSNGVAYTLQIAGQRGMNETVASLILSFESVFAALAGWAVLGETLSPRELTGCVLMACAVVLAELPSPKRRKSA
jgi:drug/metabolite transporter (DMT)-like permease